MDDDDEITKTVLARKKHKNQPSKRARETPKSNKYINLCLLWATLLAITFKLSHSTLHIVPVWLIFAWISRPASKSSIDALLLPVIVGTTFGPVTAVAAMAASLGTRGKTGVALGLLLVAWSRVVPRFVYVCPFLVQWIFSLSKFTGASLDANERILLSCAIGVYALLGAGTPWIILVSALCAFLPCQWHLRRAVDLVKNSKRGLDYSALKRTAYTIYFLWILTFGSALAFAAQWVPLIDTLLDAIHNDWRTICWWLLCLCTAFIFAANSLSFTLDTRRKLWHLCTVAMFLSKSRNELTALALSCVLVLFLVLEMIRAAALPPFSQLLQKNLREFVDHRDKRGPLVISHIYLLLGITAPILAGGGSPAGVICLGLGDTAASRIGHMYGRTKWFGSKSLEGTMAFATIVALVIISTYEAPWQQAVLIAGSTALLEAVSPINDNLVLPMYMLVLERLCL